MISLTERFYASVRWHSVCLKTTKYKPRPGGIGYVVVTSCQTRSVHHSRYWQNADIRLLKHLTTSEAWNPNTVHLNSVFVSSSYIRSLLKFQNFPETPICLSGHISPGFYRTGNPMEVIDDCTVFFLGILPHTLPSTDKNSSLSSHFTPEGRPVLLKKKVVL